MDNTFFYVSHALSNILNVSSIVTMHYFELCKDFRYEGESHDFWEMVFVDTGEMLITDGEETFTLRAGEIFFHEPGRFHNINANGSIASNVFILTFVAKSKAMKYFSHRKITADPAAKEIISKIITEGQKCYDLHFNDPYMKELKPKKNAPIGAQQLIRIYLEQLLILLMRAQDARSSTSNIFLTKKTFDNHLVSMIIAVMDENIYGSLNIAEICKRVNYGKTYTCTTFKAITGYTINNYYLMLKIAEAKKLIREGKLTFAQISEKLCFDNPQYFTKTFKRIANKTPKEYLGSIKID